MLDLYEELRKVVAALEEQRIPFPFCVGGGYFCNATEHDNVWKIRQSFEWEGRKIWIVSREGLVALKRLGGSPQDLVDIDRLENQES